MKVLLDTTAVIDATATNSKYMWERAHYFSVWEEHECYVTPITTSEVLHQIDRQDRPAPEQHQRVPVIPPSRLLVSAKP